jgi:hypothetical protein
MATLVQYVPNDKAANADLAKAVGRYGTKHPKATLATASGLRITLPYAPVVVERNGTAAVYSAVNRPGRKPRVRKTGGQLERLAYSLTITARDNQTSVETLLRQLRKAAAAGERVTFTHGPSEAGAWYLEEFSTSSALRQHGTNAITRAEATITLVEASDGVTNVGPATGGSSRPGGSKGGSGRDSDATRWRTHRVKKGETLGKIADDYYGNPLLWRVIADANKIRNPDRIKVNQTLRIPPKPRKK